MVFSAFAVYAQTHISDLSEDYNEKVEELDNISDKLIEEADEMSHTQKAKEALEMSFKQLQDQNDALHEENEELQSDVENLEGQIDESDADYSTISMTFNYVKKQFAEAQGDLQESRDVIRELKQENEELCSQLLLEELAEEC